MSTGGDHSAVRMRESAMGVEEKKDLVKMQMLLVLVVVPHTDIET